ncbi:MAG TPA: hypothetical protein DEH10_05190 [Pseudomonas sp.]|mgnify:CR=1 FL=1|nr:hypothetical protein [Pseudomonas sp.]
MYGYLCQLSFGRIVLWCYLIWYSMALVLYFDSSPVLWLTSFGIGLLMGFGMLFSSTGFPFVPIRLGRWQVFRFFFMPFCASSFSGTAIGQGFNIIAFPKAEETLAASLACGFFCLCVIGAKQWRHRTKQNIIGIDRSEPTDP